MNEIENKRHQIDYSGGDEFQKKPYFTPSNIPIRNCYHPNIKDQAFYKKIGFPGSYPYTRGIYDSMYRSKLWSIRQYAGFGSASQTNERFQYLLSEGQDALSVAFDLPTQLGLDSDHPLAKGEVGKVGVSIDSLYDMELLFKDIPLDQMRTSMTINAPAIILYCMYIAIAEKRKTPLQSIAGTIQNDILKEYIARGTYIYPPKDSTRLTIDLIIYAQKHTPKIHPISISGYHIREAGANAVQELAYTFANAITYLDEAIKHGVSIDSIAPRVSFFFSSDTNFFEEIAKFRAARRIWANLVKERYVPNDPKSCQLRFHTQTAGSTLTEQEPENNIIRVTLQALAAVLGGTQSLHTNALDEAEALPNETTARIALRTQQIIAFESGVSDTTDPLGGSYFIEDLTDEMEELVTSKVSEILEMGGAIRAVENGYYQREIQQAAYQTHKKMEAREKIVVGANKSNQKNASLFSTISYGKQNEQQDNYQIDTLYAIKKRRNEIKVLKSLRELREAATEEINVVPYVLQAVKSYCTVGEISDVFREVFGEYTGELE
ncbi:methylmalonyl-CoA mutase family protein [Aquibacillus koreensis]|uniref:Methylmalonyl-CoA mutase family protein n=1 Tax=Aquibacillus koreensis TaxID=279446 RepID=A0A9X4AGQ2_9BACI|nr:methylmalonyl-CoA mutase family protein [Aquibacillus koreensis]MCT2537468.1 methylmalonyl-CoA mutase family protein [Aquibacillus koreensis]MDC3418914.1 methylmalonyl-CoA mutase family protein [Aquibacillus koreensis]